MTLEGSKKIGEQLRTIKKGDLITCVVKWPYKNDKTRKVIFFYRDTQNKNLIADGSEEWVTMKNEHIVLLLSFISTVALKDCEEVRPSTEEEKIQFLDSIRRNKSKEFFKECVKRLGLEHKKLNL